MQMRLLSSNTHAHRHLRLISGSCSAHLILRSGHQHWPLQGSGQNTPTLFVPNNVQAKYQVIPFTVLAIVFKVKCFIGAINQSSYWCDVFFRIRHLPVELIIFTCTNCFRRHGLAVSTHTPVTLSCGVHVANLMRVWIQPMSCGNAIAPSSPHHFLSLINKNTEITVTIIIFSLLLI